MDFLEDLFDIFEKKKKHKHGYQKDYHQEKHYPAQKPAGPANFCPQCGEKNKPGNKFCVACGEKIAQGPARCRRCQSTLPPEAKFCPECGEKR